MGLKRWILAIFVPVVVLGMLVVLSFQMGADERVVKSVIPKVEKRFGVRIDYRDVSVGLTAVVFDDVSIAAEDGAPFARIGKLGVMVRVGPLLLGRVDVTGLRCEKLELLYGEGVGASAAQWRKLINGLRGAAGGAAGGAAERGRIEVHVVSGAVRAALAGFTLSIDGLSGRLADGGEAVLNADAVTLAHPAGNLLVSDSGEIRYKPEGRRASVVLEQPRFTIPVGDGKLLEVARDARDAVSSLGIDLGRLPDDLQGAAPGAPASAAAKAPSERPSLRLLVTDGSAVFVPKAPGESLSLEKISAEIIVSHRELVTGNATGGVPGTDARWVVSGSWPTGRPVHVDAEIPDLPLRPFASMLGYAARFDCGHAFADGVVALDLTRSKAEISGQASVSGLGVRHERIDDEPLADLNASLDFKATWDRAAAELHLERALVSRGQARATIRGLVRLDRMAFDLALNVPPTSCRQMLAAVPIELRREVDGVQLVGTFGLELRLAVDEAAPADTVLEAALDNLCRIEDFGPLPFPDDFRRPFTYTAYTAGGAPLRLVSGPGTDRWTTFAAISPYVIETVLTTEDGKFMNHEGLTLPEVRRAIELNLGKKELSHGASTITMQLAKNLFLTRSRTVSRKLEELFFTWYLETYFSKDEILELYLNVVEFGPSIYGIRDAAHAYFGREPRELDLAESVFLVKLLPSPVSRYDVYLQGDVSERRMGALHKVMQTMFERGRITQAELKEGLVQKIDFYREGEPLPEPRPAIAREELAPPPPEAELEPLDDEGSTEKGDEGF